MAVAISDLTEYRHRRETLREQDLRLELRSLADAVDTFTRKVEPHMRRLEVVAREVGPVAHHSFAAVRYEQSRLRELFSTARPDDAA